MTTSRLSAAADVEDFPRAGTELQMWQFLLRYATRAPSGHNTQPWRFQAADRRLRLYADRSRALPVVDPDDRALVMSCGAALAHLLVALRHFGYEGEVSMLPDPADQDLLAVIGLGQARSPGPSDHGLFEAIDNRHTHRAAFESRPVPGHVLAQLRRDADVSGVILHVITGDDPSRAVASLVRAGDRAQWRSAAFRRELAAWVRPNATRRPDGMPGFAFGISGPASRLGPMMISAFDTGSRQAAKDEQLTLTAPALVVLSTAGDAPSDWLRAGQALALVLLRATASGLAASFLNQPVEVPSLRMQLRDMLGREGFPQLMLRLGYGGTTRPTPRRPVDDVLTHAISTAGSS